MVGHARQCSREARLIDVFHRAEHLSDPLISSFWIDYRMKKSQQHNGDGEDIIADFRIYKEVMNDSNYDY